MEGCLEGPVCSVELSKEVWGVHTNLRVVCGYVDMEALRLEEILVTEEMDQEGLLRMHHSPLSSFQEENIFVKGCREG